MDQALRSHAKKYGINHYKKRYRKIFFHIKSPLLSSLYHESFEKSICENIYNKILKTKNALPSKTKTKRFITIIFYFLRNRYQLSSISIHINFADLFSPLAINSTFTLTILVIDLYSLSVIGSYFASWVI